MARQRCRLAAGACGLAAAILFYSPALAFDLNGMWASDTGNCEKIFSINGKQTTFQKDSDMFGSGFIVEGSL